MNANNLYRIVSSALLGALLVLLPSVMLAEGYTYIDAKGERAFDAQWDYAYPFSEDGAARVFRGAVSSYGYPEEGKYGFINTAGELINELQWDEASDFSEGLAAVKKDGKYGYIDIDGNVVVDQVWDYAKSFYEDGLAIVFTGSMTDYGTPDEGKYGFIDKKGKVIGGMRWDDADAFSEGLASVRADGKYGYIDTNGDIVIEPQWDLAYAFDENGLARVYTGTLSSFEFPDEGKYGYIDRQGRLITGMEWDNAGRFSEGLACVEKEGKCGFIDTEGKLVIDLQWDDAEACAQGRILVFEGTMTDWGSPDEGVYRFIDKDGNRVGDEAWDKASSFAGGLACVKKAGQYGFVDLNGQVKIKPQWDYASSFTDDGIAKVYKGALTSYGYPDGGQYGFVNAEGAYVSDLQWEDASHFSGGFAWIRENGLYGYINTEGTTAIEPKYTEVSRFSQGFAVVKMGESDFKQATWGMDQEDIISFEGAPAGSGISDGLNGASIFYHQTYCGFNALLTYYFCDAGLYEARYLFKEKDRNDAPYIEVYEAIRNAIKEKYGDPWEDQESWSGEDVKRLYAGDEEKALSLGCLQYSTYFYSDRTFVSMMMSSVNSEVQIFVSVRSNDILPPEADAFSDF